jgi:hypothetical protein
MRLIAEASNSSLMVLTAGSNTAAAELLHAHAATNRMQGLQQLVDRPARVLLLHSLDPLLDTVRQHRWTTARFCSCRQIVRRCTTGLESRAHAGGFAACRW